MSSGLDYKPTTGTIVGICEFFPKEPQEVARWVVECGLSQWVIDKGSEKDWLESVCWIDSTFLRLTLEQSYLP